MNEYIKNLYKNKKKKSSEEYKKREIKDLKSFLDFYSFFL